MLCAIGCGGGSGGGDCPAFTTIVDGSFARSGTTLTWQMELDDLPAQLEFDREGIPSFVLEYGWIIEIDADGDGTHELEVSATHFKVDGPPRTAAPLDVLQTALWTVQGPASTISGSADAVIVGNVFQFAVEEDEDPALANVTQQTQSRYTTFHQRGPKLGDQCADEL